MDKEQFLFSTAAIKLMKGVITRTDDEELWDVIVKNERKLGDYFRILNLKLQLDKDNGYCYMAMLQEEGSENLPNLVRRSRLGKYESLILVLLRKKLYELPEFSEQTVITRGEIYGELESFIKNKTNEVLELGKVDKAIKKILDIGFIRKLRGKDDHFEVLRIIESFVEAQWMNKLDELLDSYEEYFNESLEGGE